MTTEGISPDMLNEIAGMPDTMRKQMMKGRLEQILTLPDESRVAAIRGMITALHDSKIKGGDREKLIAARNEIIGEFSEDRRRSIMMSRMQALNDQPDLDKADMEITMKVMPQVSAEARSAFMETMSAFEKMSPD